MLKKYILYYLKPPKLIIKDIIIITIIGIAIFISFKIDTYEKKEITGIYNCEEECKITFPLNYKEIDLINQNSIIKYQDKKHKIKEYQKGEPYLDNGIAYEDIEITIDLETDSKIVNLNIYYNKEKLFKKIKKLIGG